MEVAAKLCHILGIDMDTLYEAVIKAELAAPPRYIPSDTVFREVLGRAGSSERHPRRTVKKKAFR